MASTVELEAELERQQKDYLSRLEKAGQLPTVISEAWTKAGGAEQTALRGQEADLLKKYVSAGAESREKYKDVWDPFAREKLASQNTALSYAPIADIRKELAMRAEALGVATSSSQAMYGAETTRAETGLQFTQSAYERALARETAAAAAAKASKSSGGSAKKSNPKNDLKQDITDNLNYWANEIKATPAPFWTENTLLPALYSHYEPLGLSRAEIKKMVFDMRKPYEQEGYF